MDNASEIILSSDEKAAQLKTVTGWVSAKGHFYGQGTQAESMARYDGSTHRPCSECGELIEKSGYCRPCRAKQEIAKYNAMPRKKWDGKALLYSQVEDRYFNDADDLDSHCEYMTESDIPALRLIICEPTYAGEIDPNEHYYDDLPEEGEIPNDLQKAFDDLNAFLRETKIILSWSPGKYAAELAGKEDIPHG